MDGLFFVESFASGDDGKLPKFPIRTKDKEWGIKGTLMYISLGHIIRSFTFKKLKGKTSDPSGYYYYKIKYAAEVPCQAHYCRLKKDLKRFVCHRHLLTKKPCKCEK